MSEATDAPDLPSRLTAERARLDFPGAPAWIEPAAEYLRRRAVLAGVCAEKRSGRLLVALHEALANAVVHGNLGLGSELKEGPDGAFAEALARRAADPRLAGRPVEVEVAYDGAACHWAITDQGAGFDVARVLGRAESDQADVLLASGRGVLMMRSLLDGVRYELGGRRAVLTLRRDAGAERRRADRVAAHEPLHVAPVRADGTVDWASACAAVARNVSEGGVALLQARLAQCERVLIGMAGAGEKVEYVPAEVRHCRPLPGGGMELGCRFLTGPDEAATPPEQLGAVQRAVAALLEGRAAAPPGPERRAHPRVAYTERLDVLVEGRPTPVVAFARDLSKGGVAFIARASLPEEVTVVFPPRDGGAGPRVRARVVRCVKVVEGFYDIGARFVRLDQ